MATENQVTGALGEELVTKICSCPRCKRKSTLKRLPPNFRCADVICDFCGYLAQVKASKADDFEKVPNTIPGAAWGVQQERMDAGIYFPLFIVRFKSKTKFAIFYLSADLQTKEMFMPRNPLKKTARRAGWTGFNYDLRNALKGGLVRLA